MGPTLKKNKTKQTKQTKGSGRGVKSVEKREIFKFFFYSIRFSQIYGNLTVGFRQDKHEKCYMRRGLRVGTRNTRFHLEFR